MEGGRKIEKGGGTRGGDGGNAGKGRRGEKMKKRGRKKEWETEK